VNLKTLTVWALTATRRSRSATIYCIGEVVFKGYSLVMMQIRLAMRRFYTGGEG
jgi:hypothetical protein